MDNVHNLPTVRQTGGLALAQAPTVLGQNPLRRIPSDGRIRPGIRVLTKQFEGNREAVAIYARGVAAGVPFVMIDKQIREALKLEKSPLTPRNVPYFTVRGCDFTDPKNAEKLMALAEDRGDGRHLYRFPVKFASDDWQTWLPHEYVAWAKSSKRYWSAYIGAPGQEARYCMQYAPLDKDPRASRYTKPSTGRRVIARTNEDGGLCVPERCNEYQRGECKLTGSLLFYVPGLSGTLPVELPMTSYYGLEDMRIQLALMLQVRGRLKSYANEPPLFHVTKQLREISRLDPETGQATRVKQWIATLQATLDMTEAIAMPAPVSPHPALAHAERVALEAPIVPADRYDDPDVDEEIVIIGEDDPDHPDDGAPSLEDLRPAVRERVRALRIRWEDFMTYATRKWGDGWKDDVVRLAAIRDEVDGVENADLYRDNVLEDF